MSKIIILFIKLYQVTKIRKKPKCLHYPSCSNYAILALKKYPLHIAISKSIKRIRDCNPFSSRDYIDYP